MASVEGQARRVGRPATVSREQIVAAALRIIQTRGVSGLSMRVLSNELGAGKTTAYHHVLSKAELLELAVAEVANRVELPPVDPEHWDVQLHDVAVAMRESARLYPGLVTYASKHRTDASHRFNVWFHDLFLAAGFDVATTRGAYALLRGLFVTDLDEMPVERRPSAADDDPGRESDVSRDDFSTEFYESIEGQEASSDSLFHYGLDHLIDGLRLRLHA